MDDIDTRLEAERPDVADALRSMNWEERLEKARARRKAVLRNPENSGKRPVVRIVDAAAVAQRRSGAQVQAATAVAPATLEAPRVVPLHPAEPPGVAPQEAPATQDAAPPADRRSLLGRTALGFGLGLGLGTSLLAGALLLLADPFAPAVVDPDAIPQVATAAVGVTPAAAAGPEVPPVLGAPALSAVSPAEPPAPMAVMDAAAPPSALAMASGQRPAPVMPTRPGAEAVLRMPAPLAAPAEVVADISLATMAAPAEGAAAAVPGPIALPTRLARPTLAGAVSSDPFTFPEANVPRPAANDAPPALIASFPAASALRLPEGVAAPLLVSLPARPADVAPPDRSPAAVTAPPDLPPPLTEADDIAIPNGSALLVRIAAPDSVPDAEAEEFAALIEDVGIGEGRVGRVGFRVSETHLRFYHREDAAAAAALGEVIGTEVRDFTSFRPSPPEGTLEIFLAGEGASPPPRAAAPTRARPQPPDEMTRMRDRIVNRLRRGEHL
jgi:hypothetical protein